MDNTLPKVISCHDGDTLKDSKNISYRILGIDSPEISHSWNNFEESTGIEHYFALKAKEFCVSHLVNKRIKIISNQKETYGRHVARIIINNIDYALQLLRIGLARVAYISENKKSRYFYRDFEYIKELKKAEKHAKKLGYGIWAYSNQNSIFPKLNF